MKTVVPGKMLLIAGKESRKIVRPSGKEEWFEIVQKIHSMEKLTHVLRLKACIF